jgi:hypothetical protein
MFENHDLGASGGQKPFEDVRQVRQPTTAPAIIVPRLFRRHGTAIFATRPQQPRPQELHDRSFLDRLRSHVSTHTMQHPG